MKVPSYLEEFMDEIGTLPTALKGRFSEMREMDDRANAFMLDADKAVAETLRRAAAKGPNTDALKRSYQEVISLQGKAMEQATHKVETSEKAFNVVDEVIRNLDDKLREFESQLRKDGRWPTTDKPPRPTTSSAAAGSSAGAGASASGSVTQNNNNNSNSSGVMPTSAGASTQQKSARRSTGGRNQGATTSNRNNSNTANGNNNSNSNSKMTKLAEEIQDTITTVTESLDPNEPRYCTCNGVSYGEMVGCDRDECPIQWFHFGCVGLTKAPPDGERWLCPDCAKLKHKPEHQEEH